MPTSCTTQQDAMLLDMMELDCKDAQTECGILQSLKQEHPPKMPGMRRLACFFCDEDFNSVELLQSHQAKCSSVSDIQMILSNAQSSRTEKKAFLSQFSLIPKGKAEHLRSVQRKDVVVDVIVIDDDSDDDNKEIAANKSSTQYLQSPTNACDSNGQKKKICSRKSLDHWTYNGKVTKQRSSKVFKFDITSPLGMRLRYHGTDACESRLPYSRVINRNYEQYCNLPAAKRSESATFERFYPVTYRKSRQQKYCHMYKFTKRQSRKFLHALQFGLDSKSYKLKEQLKPCRVKLTRLNLQNAEANETFNVKQFSHLLPLDQQQNDCIWIEPEDLFEGQCDFTVDCQKSASVDPVSGMEVDRIVPSTAVSRKCNRPGLHFFSGSAKVLMHNSGPVQPRCLNGNLENSQVSIPQNRDSISNIPKSVRLIPLLSLQQATAADSDCDQAKQLFQISDVYSLAEVEPTTVQTTAQVQSPGVNCSLRTSQNRPSSASLQLNDEPVTMTDCRVQEKSQLETKSCGSVDAEVCGRIDRQVTAVNGLRLPVIINSEVIDLTVGSSGPCVQPQLSETVPNTESHCIQSPVNLLHVSEKQSNYPVTNARLVSVSASPVVNYADVNGQSLLEPGTGQKPIVIEIPDDDDDSMTDKTCRSSAKEQTLTKHQSISNCLANRPSGDDGSMRRFSAGGLESSPDTQRFNVSVNRQQAPCDPRRVETSHAIDLSVDSDCEELGGETTPVGQHKPPRLNSSSCSAPKPQPETAPSLGRSSLPPLTFKCHICGCLFEFTSNSAVLIRRHYFTHNITNIELVRQMLPNGQVTWSLVELENNGSNRPPPVSEKSRENGLSNSVSSNENTSVRQPLNSIHPFPSTPISSRPPTRGQGTSRSLLLNGQRLPSSVGQNLGGGCRRPTQNATVPVSNPAVVSSTSGSYLRHSSSVGLSSQVSNAPQITQGPSESQQMRPSTIRQNPFRPVYIAPQPDSVEQMTTVHNFEPNRSVPGKRPMTERAPNGQFVSNSRTQSAGNRMNITRAKDNLAVSSPTNNNNTSASVICLD